MPREGRNAEGASAFVVVIYGYRRCERSRKRIPKKRITLQKVPGAAVGRTRPMSILTRPESCEKRDRPSPKLKTVFCDRTVERYEAEQAVLRFHRSTRRRCRGCAGERWSSNIRGSERSDRGFGSSSSVAGGRSERGLHFKSGAPASAPSDRQAGIFPRRGRDHHKLRLATG